MNIPVDFDQKGGSFKMEVVVPPYSEDEYKKYAWETLKREVGLQLYGLIEQARTPVTIEIFEDIIKSPKFSQIYYNAPPDKLRIRVVFTPVKYREVTLCKEYTEQFIVPTKLDKFYSKIRQWIYRGKK